MNVQEIQDRPGVAFEIIQVLEERADAAQAEASEHFTKARAFYAQLTHAERARDRWQRRFARERRNSHAVLQSVRAEAGRKVAAVQALARNALGLQAALDKMRIRAELAESRLTTDLSGALHSKLQEAQCALAEAERARNEAHARAKLAALCTVRQQDKAKMLLGQLEEAQARADVAERALVTSTRAHTECASLRAQLEEAQREARTLRQERDNGYWRQAAQEPLREQLKVAHYRLAQVDKALRGNE